MTHWTKLVLALCLVTSLIACSRSEEPAETVEGSSDTAQADSKGSADPNVVTGDELTENYVALLCQKYEDCGIQAFSDREDCKTRIRALLTEDPKWKELKLAKDRLETCLADFKGLTCDDFKTGQSPESCKKLSS